VYIASQQSAGGVKWPCGLFSSWRGQSKFEKRRKTRGGLCRRDFSVAVYRRLRPRHVVCQRHSIRVQVPTTTCLKHFFKKDLQNSLVYLSVHRHPKNNKRETIERQVNQLIISKSYTRPEYVTLFTSS
jgi:hypothetical protein